MIVLITDFGLEGPYIGQMKTRILRDAPDAQIIDLFSDASVQNEKASSYLISAYAPEFPPGTIFLCVIDPGVGGARPGVVVEADERWYVGPGNGLFEMVMRRAIEKSGSRVRRWEITWTPEILSASFHGRDIFAPIAAKIHSGDDFEGDLRPLNWNRFEVWPDDLAEIIYIDHYGNAMTGIRDCAISQTNALKVNEFYLQSSETFSDVSPGTAFWYINANGLAEIAVNKGRAADILKLDIGMQILIKDLEVI